ncbi:MAG: GreA/GreB family elongation factor [Patescibacteria group bacterium]
MNDQKTISIGSKIKINLNGEIKELEIVDSTDTNPKNGKISHLSPIGQATLGRQTGESFELILPNGKKMLGQIVQINE